MGGTKGKSEATGSQSQDCGRARMWFMIRVLRDSSISRVEHRFLGYDPATWAGRCRIAPSCLALQREPCTQGYLLVSPHGQGVKNWKRHGEQQRGPVLTKGGEEGCSLRCSAKGDREGKCQLMRHCLGMSQSELRVPRVVRSSTHRRQRERPPQARSRASSGTGDLGQDTRLGVSINLLQSLPSGPSATSCSDTEFHSTEWSTVHRIILMSVVRT
jgi:hypothetical protein